MKWRKSGTLVLWYECFGFGLILLLTWLNELTNLPDILIAGQHHVSNIRYSVIETCVILVIWAIVLLLTRRLVTHLHHLEGFLRVCAWCRKVGYKGEWMPLEQYFVAGFNIETTHGMCPECLKRIEEDTRRFYLEDLKKRAAENDPAKNPVIPGEESVPPAGLAAEHQDAA